MATLDHVIPQAKGGGNHRSNMVMACQECNCLKGDTYNLPISANAFFEGTQPLNNQDNV